MSKPLWPAVSGAMARDHQVEVIANNLANVNTNGYKRDDVTFKEYLSKKENMETVSEDIPRSPIKDKDLYPLDGRDTSFVITNGTHTKFSTGGFKITDNPTDMALEGPGFFEVATPAGIRYTRAGSFKVGSDGKLVTSEGHPVLLKGSESAEEPGVGGEPVVPGAGREINLAGREGALHVNGQGDVYMGDEKVGQLNIVEFGDLNQIRKVGGSNFENKNVVANPPQVATKTAVKQGIIETSNVNPVQEISNLIRANRMFEQDLKAMKTVNEMMQKEVNDIAKF